MNETRFRDLERLYERAGKPRWPWWWYGVGVVLCVLALILILCSGPGKARAGMPMTDIKAVVDKANEPGAKAQAWFLWGPRFVPHQEAILLAFGCAETAD